jgi:hypothetical protein
MKMDGSIQYIIKVGIGSPPQEFDMVVDTGSSDVLLLLNNPQRPRLQHYNPAVSSSTFSSTGQNFKLKYGAGRCSGVVSSDIMTIGGYKIAGLHYGEAHKEGPVLKELNADGVLGLAMVGLSKVTKPPFLAQVLKIMPWLFACAHYAQIRARTHGDLVEFHSHLPQPVSYS